MLDLDNYLTASGSYPERSKSPELTPQLIANATDLIKRVNNLLNRLQNPDIKVSSGFRPSNVNASVANSAKKSLHMTCKAVDILDDSNQTLGNQILANPELLVEYGLWMEDLNSTKGKNTNWVHLDCGVRSPRSIRVFIP